MSRNRLACCFGSRHQAPSATTATVPASGKGYQTNNTGHKALAAAQVPTPAAKTTSGETSYGEAVPRPARDHQAEPAKSFCGTKPILQVNWPRVSWIVTATS
jgi:hypothetical protein